MQSEKNMRVESASLEKLSYGDFKCLYSSSGELRVSKDSTCEIKLRRGDRSSYWKRHTSCLSNLS